MAIDRLAWLDDLIEFVGGDFWSSEIQDGERVW